MRNAVTAGRNAPTRAVENFMIVDLRCPWLASL
jgi:hypothetical protein